jgi:hypothetical protein
MFGKLKAKAKSVTEEVKNTSAKVGEAISSSSTSVKIVSVLGAIYLGLGIAINIANLVLLSKNKKLGGQSVHIENLYLSLEDKKNG